MTAVESGRVKGRYDEALSFLTAVAGLVLAIIGVIYLRREARSRPTDYELFSLSIYGVTLFSMFVASTLYHGARHLRLRRILRVVDHSCIYLLIAGTYTPFALINMRPGWGWVIFGTVWFFALVGVFLKVFFFQRTSRVSTFLYLALGWLVLLALKPLIESVPAWGLFWLTLGGIVTSIGTIFYRARHIPYSHAIWHLFVIGGSTCHFVAVMFFAIPHTS